MSLILHIESGTEVCSVALSREEKILAEKESVTGRNHARDLGPFVKEILAAGGVRAEELDAVAVGMGPGSYTGLRVGVSLAKGICYGAGIPLIAVDSLESLACMALENAMPGEMPEGTLLCPMIDARRMEVYTRLYDLCLHPLTEVAAVVVEEDSFADLLADRIIVAFGDGAAKCAEVIRADNFRVKDVRSSARGMISAALRKFRQGNFVDTAYFEPYYLKDFVVKSSTKKIL